MVNKKPRKQKWDNIRHPEDNEIKEYLNKNPDTPGWKLFRDLIRNQPKTKEEKTGETIIKFINDIDYLHPGSESRLENLAPLIQYLLEYPEDNKRELDPDYIKMLMKMCKGD